MWTDPSDYTDFNDEYNEWFEYGPGSALADAVTGTNGKAAEA